MRWAAAQRGRTGSEAPVERAVRRRPHRAGNAGRGARVSVQVSVTEPKMTMEEDKRR